MGSETVGQLSLLKAEFASAKSRWEYLCDRIMNGYKDAYNEHANALKQFRQIREYHEKQDAAAMMFIYSVVSVAFAGGLAGGLLAPWVKQAASKTFAEANQFTLAAMKANIPGAIRAGVQDTAKALAKEATGAALKHIEGASKISPTAYEPVTPETFDLYLEKKEQLDGCFARFDELIDQLQGRAGAENWPIETAWALFNGFRAYCPLLRDKPDPDHLPDRTLIAKTAELCMWVQWTEQRDWPWWNEQYAIIDRGLPSESLGDRLMSGREITQVVLISAGGPLCDRINAYPWSPECTWLFRDCPDICQNCGKGPHFREYQRKCLFGPSQVAQYKARYYAAL